MKKLKVPVLAIRFMLIVSFLFAMLMAFFVGALSGDDASSVIEKKEGVPRLFKRSGFRLAVAHFVTNNRVPLEKAASLLFAKGVVRVALYVLPGDKPLWVSKKGMTKVMGLSDSVRKSIWQPFLQNRLIDDKIDGVRSFFVVPFDSGGKKYAGVLFFSDVSGAMSLISGTMRVKLARVARSVAQSWKRFLLLGVVFVLFSVFTGFFASSFWVRRPVREFAALLDRWDSREFSYKKLKGPMRYLLMHVVELVERTRQHDAVGNRMLLEQLLPVKFGYDYPGFSASAFFVRNLEEKKDYYDIFRLEDGKYLLFMGEVSGAGESASALMVRLYWVVRAYCRSFSNPSMVLSAVNKYFFEEKESVLINGFVGYFEPAKGELVFSQAGGLPVYRFNPDKGESKSYHLDIPPMGLLDPELFDSKLTYAKLAVQRGELLGLFTDGILKVEGYDWESRIKTLFSGKDNLGEKVIALRAEIQERVGVDRRSDDIAGLFVEA